MRTNRKSHGRKSEKESLYRRIDFQYNISNEYKDNTVISYHYTILSIIPKTLFQEFQNISYLWFLVIITLEFSPYCHNKSLKWSTLFPMLILIVYALIENIARTYKRYKLDCIKNNAIVKVLGSAEFVKKNCCEIHVGDILLIENQEFAPADVLLLAVDNTESECFVNMTSVVGGKDLIKKKPVKETQAFITTDGYEVGNLLKHIENIRITQPNSSFKQFSGKIKMKGNPKVSKVGIQNLVIRGTQLIGCNWIIGLAVYTGMETKIWLNSKKPPIIKISKLHRFVNFIMVINFGILLVYTFLSFGLSYRKRIEGVDEDWDEVFVSLLILFNSFVPVSLYLAMRISKVLQMLLINARHKNIRIESSEIFENLGKIEYVLLGKTGTLTEDYLKVQTCIIGTQVYRETDDNDENEKLSSRFKCSEVPLNFDDSNLKLGCDYNTFDILANELRDDSYKQEFWYFILCLSICNHYFPNQDMKNISADEKVMISLVEELGISPFQRAGSLAILKRGETEHKYDILCGYGFYSEQKFNKILIKNKDSNEIILLVKGSLDCLQSLFDDSDDSSSFEAALKSPYLENLRKIICGYKLFSEKNAKEFLFDYKNAKLSPVNFEGRLASVFEKHEKGLKYLGIIGIENPIKKGTKNCVMQLNQAGIKTWIITGDSEESTLLTGLATGMYTKDSNIVRLSSFFSPVDCLQLLNSSIKSEIFHQEVAISDKGSSIQVSEAFSKMKNDMGLDRVDKSKNDKKNHEETILKVNSRVKKYTKKRKPVHPILSSLSNLSDDKSDDIKAYEPFSLNFILSVDSIGFDYALSSSSHRKKFVSLLFTAKSVFFHSMSPDQKIKLVKLLKRNFSFGPTIMAIGDGNTNSGMLGEADISITVAPPNTEFEYAPDARIEKFSDLSLLILNIGHYTQVRISRLVLLTIYREMLINTFMLLFQIQTNFSGNPLFHYDLYVIYELFITLVPLVYVGVFYKDDSVLIQATNNEGTFDSKIFFNDKEEYPERYISPNLHVIKIVLSYFSGGLHGIIIYVACVYGMNYVVNKNGFTEDLNTKGVVGFILVSMAFSSRIMSDNLYYVRFNLVAYFLFILMILIVVGLVCQGNVGDGMMDYRLLVDSGNVWFIICVVPFVVFFVCMLCVYTLQKINNIQATSRLEQYKDDLYKVFKDTQEWNENEISNELQLDKYSTKFLSNIKENHYQSLISQENKPHIRIGVLFLFLVSWIIFIIKYSNAFDDYKPDNKTVIAPVLLTIECLFLLYKRLMWEYFIIAHFIVTMIFSITQTSFVDFTIGRYPVIAIFFTLCVNFRTRYAVVFLVCTYVVSIVIGFAEASLFDKGNMLYLSLHSVVLMLGICILSFLITYINDVNKRKEFVYLQKVEFEVFRTKNILSLLLPQFVRKRVKEGVRYIAEDKGTVSVIFCDMCNFDDIVNIYPPQELTSFLDEIFSKLDKICEAIGVTKIETVGKTYLACAGLKDSEVGLDPSLSRVPHARRTVEMGLAVLREISKIVLKNGMPLMFKVGINSGPVTAGVVGFHKPQFSLVGDTVNTASRMSSTLTEVNSIQISMATYDLLGDRSGLTFSDRCPDVKGKGKMDTKLVDVPKQTSIEPIDIGLNGSSLGHNKSLILNSSYKASSGVKITESPGSLGTPTILNGLEVEDPEELIEKSDSKYVSRIITFYERENSVELDFRLMFLDDYFYIQYYGIIINIVINGLMLLIEILLMIYAKDYSYPSNFIVLAIEEVLMVLMGFLVKKHYKKKIFAYGLVGIFSLEFVGFFVSSFFDKPFVTCFVLFFDFRFLLVNYCSGVFLGKLLLPDFFIGVFWVLVLALHEPSYGNFLFSGLFIIIVLISKYTQESRMRINSIIKQAAVKDVEKTEELLTQMMPPHVLKNLQEENPVTDRLSYVTLMYADIVGFTAWSSTKTSKEVVGMLSQLFTRFDKLCLMYDVYKVHTIGDCYVVMGYKTDHKRNPAKEAENVVKFANSLINVIEETNQFCNCELSMRIGIHTGEVIGGITGTNIVRYDIYGADVLIANKMESNGEPGKIVVSEMTKMLLEDYNSERYKFTQTKEIEIPVLYKTVKMFLLTDLSEVLDIES